MIHHFENEIVRNPFNPSYKYFIFEENYSKQLKLKSLKSFILNNEKNIIKKYEKDFKEKIKNSDWVDGGTGLGVKSLTSRMPFYNLLKYKQVSYIKEIIKLAHNQFLKEISLTYTGDLYVICWANVMRKDEEIKKHFHAANNWDYLSGHICVNTKDTSTNYCDPYFDKIFSSKNELGKITLFPSWVKHYTDKVKYDEERITIAFDMRYEESFNKDIFSNKKDHWVKL